MTRNYNSTTTLRRIREGSPKSGRACQEGYTELLAHLGKVSADDEPVDLVTVLDSNGLYDALWVLSYAMPDDRLARHFQAWCAEQVLHSFEAERPNDIRVAEQIKMLRNDAATDPARDAAVAAAWDAASAARAAAARYAAVAAVAAAWDAASAARSAAARDAARGDVWDAAWSAAWDAARDDQEKQLRKMIEEEA